MERRVEQEVRCDVEHQRDRREHTLVELILDACDHSEDAMEIGDWIGRSWTNDRTLMLSWQESRVPILWTI